MVKIGGKWPRGKQSEGEDPQEAGKVLEGLKMVWSKKEEKILPRKKKEALEGHRRGRHTPVMMEMKAIAHISGR